MSREQPNRLRVLVTGASGFVGGRVVEAMFRSGFAAPVAGIRHWSRAARVARAPVEVAVCDILDRGQVGDVVRGVHAIVHCAYSDGREAIVTGTKNLLEAARTHGIARFVMLSTAEVYGADVGGAVTEARPTPKTGRMYGDSKIEAEELCREFDARGVRATILRPSLVYGPYSRSWTVAIAKRLLSGKWKQFDELGDGVANLVYVDDLVQAILRSLSRPEAQGETFNINGPEQPTWNEYFSRFNECLGLPPLARASVSQARFRTRVRDVVGRTCGAVRSRFEDPLMRIYLRGGWAGRMMKQLKGALDATPSGSELNGLFARKAVYEDSKARHLLGYTPRFDLATGLELSIAWLRHHGQIDDAPALGPSVDQERAAPNSMKAGRRVLVMEDALT